VLKTNLTGCARPIGMKLVRLHPTGVLPQYGAVPRTFEAPAQESDCQAWRLETLEEVGSMRPRDTIAAAAAAGFSQATVYRARAELGKRIVNTRSGVVCSRRRP
jgi:hypothetical protein